MWPNPLETADLVTFTEEIFNGKFHFLSSDTICDVQEKWAETMENNLIPKTLFENVLWVISNH